jgi:hypothetical protein
MTLDELLLLVGLFWAQVSLCSEGKWWAACKSMA